MTRNWTAIAASYMQQWVISVAGEMVGNLFMKGAAYCAAVANCAECLTLDIGI